MNQKKKSGHHDDDALTLADLLKSRREDAGLTLARMADKLKVSRPYLARLESGEYQRPSPAILGRIAKGLNIRPADLYALTGYIPLTELPSFPVYVRTMHPDWPEGVINLLTDFHDFLRLRHSLD
jgi:transcriptional regulator with XRE-family HTH domain